MSMDCPQCQGKARCLDSRPSEQQSTRRRYECPECKLRWFTIEYVVGVYQRRSSVLDLEVRIYKKQTIDDLIATLTRMKTAVDNPQPQVVQQGESR